MTLIILFIKGRGYRAEASLNNRMFPYISTMSSISSCDSFHISIEDDDDPYIKRLNELEEEHSGSDSGSSSDNNLFFMNDAEKTQNMKKELEIVSLYLKCKKGFYNSEYRKHKTYSDAILFVSLFFSSSVVIFPFFSAEMVTMSSLGLITTICIFFKYYLNFDISSNELNTISLRYGKILVDAETFLSKLVYFSNKVEKQSAFYEKMREIETKLYYFAEEVPSSDNVFTSIHGIEMQQTALLSRYKMVNREIDQIKGKTKDRTAKDRTTKDRTTKDRTTKDRTALDLLTRDKNRLEYLKENKKKIKEQLNNPDYSIIREPLEQEYQKYLWVLVRFHLVRDPVPRIIVHNLNIFVLCKPAENTVG